MTNTEKNTVKTSIETHLSKLEKQIIILEENAKPIVPDCSLGRLTRAEAMTEQDVNNRILDEAKHRLIRLKNALSRIDKPMFAICIECDEAISLGRMLVRPESVRCVECAN